MIRLLTAFAGLPFLPLAIAAPVPAHLMPKNPPLAVPTRLGTTWVYEECGMEKTLVITNSEEKSGARLVTTEWVEADGQYAQHMVVSVTEKGVFVIAERGVKYDTPWCLLKLPYVEGQTWETKSGAVEGTMKAGPVERVKVPAGEFSAVRVDWEFSLGEGRGTDRSLFWYAPGVGLVRLDRHLKLKSFSPGKD